MNPVVTPSSSVNDVRDAIREFGMLATYTIPSATVDVGTSSRSGSATTYSVEVTSPAPVSSDQINGTTVLEGDLQCMLSARGLVSGDQRLALTFTPSAGHRLTTSGAVYAIVGVEQAAWSGTVIAYHMRLRL